MPPVKEIHMMDRFARKPRIASHCLLLVTAFLLAGCAGDPVTLDSGVRTPGNEKAYLMPRPGAFAITGIVEQRYGNALTQQIFLSTDSSVAGSNVAEIKAFGTRNPNRYGDNKISFKPLTEAQIAREIRAALPTVRMTKSDFFVQNEYGSFGYAMGRPSSGELCMYAWQQIRSQGSGNLFAQRGALQIGVRLCKAGATESELLSFMYGFTITGAVDVPGWNPYGAPPETPERLGMTGAPMFPMESATVLPKVAPVAPRRTHSSTSATRKPSVKRQSASTVQQTPSVTVPSPSDLKVAVPRTNASTGPAVIVPLPNCVGAGDTLGTPCS